MNRGLLLCLSLLAFPALASSADRAWRFRVFLDDKPIGHHEFRLREVEDRIVVETQASFEYKFLFVKLYEYRHRNVELWQDDCLMRIESRTDDNGEPYEVRGELTDDRFLLEGLEGPTELPACIMSFAYWDPSFLEQDRLLNTQNGELVEIEVADPEPVDVEVRGAMQPALRYRLSAEALGIELWYSRDREWLALEAEAGGGRKLRYELM